MKVNEKIDRYLNEEKLNEGYHADIELERFENSLVNWISECEEIVENEGGSKADIKFVKDVSSNIDKALDIINRRIKLLQKHMKRF